MNPVIPLMLVGTLFGFAVGQTYISKYTGIILANVYQSFTTGDKKLFYESVFKGLGVIGVSALFDSSIQFIVALMGWNWRKTLCFYIQNVYFKKSLFYKIIAFNDNIDNPDQRITSDIDKFTTLLASIVSNCITGPMVVIYYTYLCYTTIEWYAPLIVYAYFFLGYFVNKLVISPMVSINYLQDKLEGDFRYLHQRVRNFSESIALFNYSKNKSNKPKRKTSDASTTLRKSDSVDFSEESADESTVINRKNRTPFTKTGNTKSSISEEKRKKLEEEFLVEERQAKIQFESLLANKKRVIFWNFGLTTTSDLFTYLSPLVNYFIIAMPVFFLHTKSALLPAEVTVQSYNCIMLASGFSQYINVSTNISDLAGFISRISSMIEVCSKVLNDDSYETETSSLNEKDGSNDSLNQEIHVNTTNRSIRLNQGENIILDDITYFTPKGNQLFSNITVCIEKGKNLLIMGPSGSGKSSLIRVINGLWPFFKGRINRPESDKIFFLPQQPYLIFGELEEQILYPLSKKDKRIPKKQLRELFARLDIDYLLDRENFIKKSAQINDLTHNWLNSLSPGEQQLISIIRLLYHSPQFALLDEATSSIPQSLEEKVYQIAKELNITIISVGHRVSLLKHHDNLLRFDKYKNWFFEEIDHNQ
ncbi:hypothetical protein DICPUDRAFT_48982 [Dictyostelium purpureum]|uniref:ABC transporter domain-containing protein n=1 Tax=Dictyostelium purpureum TaxID=5786 RepID=F0ZRV5_DICPU|nr:uncharacterized protein DICPUDRAFT_48982 [Dictyostelium purpureum]EGC33328.1 hypothetical protein DICPUDRAFT_48982 [Dictyostelium purpureum]|eukprot:XP_003290144.1 hypothetical protein DICPUDRAFT_48982 [Dictyostelium purpureum]